MKIKNYEVKEFANFLINLELKGRESRLRTRFVKVLMGRADLIDEEHVELIKQFAKFDDKGEPIIIEIDGVKTYDVPEKEAFNKEYYALLNEEFILEENEERKEMLLLLKEVILNCEMTFKGREALEYDRWCEIVEEIVYE
jgi:hypothetical protein